MLTFVLVSFGFGRRLKRESGVNPGLPRSGK
jgi:hypothetical protein